MVFVFPIEPRHASLELADRGNHRSIMPKLGSTIPMNAAAILLLVNACTPSVTIDADGRTIEHHYGYVRVVKPPTRAASENFRAEGITTVGIKIDNGIGIGFFRADRIYVPLDCRIVSIVSSQAQFDHLVEILSKFERDSLCVAVAPSAP